MIELKISLHNYKNNFPFRTAFLSDDPFHASHFSFYDEESVRHMYWDIKPNDWVLDIGADYGSYTLTALAMGASKVFAWSPQILLNDISASDLLKVSLDLNEWKDKCEVYISGIYSKAGWINVVTQQFLDEEPRERNYDIIKVEPLDDWYDNVFKKMDYKSASGFFLKMDIEGAEAEALKSGERFLREIHPRLLIENHNCIKYTLEQEVRHLLLSFGYQEVSTTPYHSVSHSLYK